MNFSKRKKLLCPCKGLAKCTYGLTNTSSSADHADYWPNYNNMTIGELVIRTYLKQLGFDKHSVSLVNYIDVFFLIIQIIKCAI